MPAKPNVCVVLQWQQITFKGEGGANIFKKDLYYYYYYYCNYYYSVIIIIIAVATGNNDEINKTLGAAPKKFSNLAPLFPSLNAIQGTTYFKDVLKRIDRMKVFTIPSWMPRLKESDIPLNLSPPS